jgi:hypothetical protein
MSLEELAGWIGAILVLIAYCMVTLGKAKAESTNFQLINIIGAAFLVFYTYSLKAYASMSVNIIWVLIGVSSFRSFLRSKSYNFERLLNNIKEGAAMKTKTKLVLTVLTTVFLLSISSQSFADDIDDAEIDETLTTSEIVKKSAKTPASTSLIDSDEEMDSEIDEEDSDENIPTKEEDGSEDAEVSVDESE